MYCVGGFSESRMNNEISNSDLIPTIARLSRNFSSLVCWKNFERCRISGDIDAFASAQELEDISEHFCRYLIEGLTHVDAVVVARHVRGQFCISLFAGRSTRDYLSLTLELLRVDTDSLG